MTVLDALLNEVAAVREQDLLVHHVRVTPHALPGSIVAVPVAHGARDREVLVHPDDWIEIHDEVAALMGTDGLFRASALAGFPVVHG
jgi:hypothetical protein